MAVRVLGGAALVAVGVVLLAVAPRSAAVVTAVAAAGLGLHGAVRLAGALRRRALVRGRPVAWLPDAVVGATLLAAAVVVLVWRTASVRTLAAVLAAGLVVHGVVGLVAALRGRRRPRAVGPPMADGRVASAPLAAASVLAGLLVVAWPRLSLFLLALVVGAWLVATGLAALAAPLRHRLTRRVPRAVRRGVRVLATSGALVVALLAVALTAWIHRGDPRVTPDGFYDPPAAVPAQPGRLLRADALVRGIPDGLRAWRILYTTTDGDGHARVASGAVLAREPAGDAAQDSAEGAEGAPVVAVGHGTTGVVPRCAPTLAAEPFADGASAALERMVRDGWVGVMSDYVGLGTAGPHAYLVGDDAAHDVLDSVRAARELTDHVPAAPALADDVVVWGHSQGGHAALWTGILAPAYAPELQVRGIAALAPPTDLVSLADDLATTAIGKLVTAYIVASWDQVHPDLRLRAQVAPGYDGVVDRIGDLCFHGRDVLAALAVATQVSRELLPRAALDGDLGDLLRAQAPVAPVPAPVLLAQGATDPLVLPAQQRAFVADRCAAGQPLDYREYAGLDHLSLVADDSPLVDELVAWTRDRLAGAPARDTC